MIGAWILINRQGEGVKMHPVYKSNMHITMNYNFRFHTLYKIGKSESRLYDTEISTTKNEFTVAYNDSTRITYRYSFNESGDILKTYYTDVNGKEQELTFITSKFMPPLKVVPPAPHSKQIAKILETIEDNTENEETADKDSTIYQVVEQQPEFPGGMKALMKYLRDNINYPRISRENKSQGKSFVSFIVKMDGSIENVEIIRSSGDELLDKEAIRVVRTMPDWIPGKQGGKAVNVRFTLPVTF